MMTFNSLKASPHAECPSAQGATSSSTVPRTTAGPNRVTDPWQTTAGPQGVTDPWQTPPLDPWSMNVGPKPVPRAKPRVDEGLSSSLTLPLPPSTEISIDKGLSSLPILPASSSRTPKTCPMGHPLRPWFAPGNRDECDHPGHLGPRIVLKGSPLLGCRQCNWGICPKCAGEAQVQTTTSARVLPLLPRGKPGVEIGDRHQ